MGLVVATATLVLFALRATPETPYGLPLLSAVAFAAYPLWMAISAIWAPSDASVWLAAGRSATYALIILLAFAVLQAREARLTLRYGFLIAGLIVAALCLWRLISSPDINSLFYDRRLAYPVGYPNNAAALFLVIFWPVLWVAADPEERWYIRAPSLGLCTALLGLASLTQSRGAFWAFIISATLTLALSPARLRVATHLAVPLGLATVMYPRLNELWLLGPQLASRDPVLRWLLPSVLGTVIVGLIMARVDRSLQITARTRVIAGVLGVAAVLGIATVGLALSPYGLRPPADAIVAQWHSFANDLRGLSPEVGPEESTDGTLSASRFLIPGSSGRWDLWRVAWLDFHGNPVTGVGAGNYLFTFNRYRSSERYGREAHSLLLQALADTGVVGAFLLFGSIGFALVTIVVYRLRKRGRRVNQTMGNGQHMSTSSDLRSPDYNMAWVVSLMTSIIYWLLHGAVDWLWEMPAVTIPGLMCLALALSVVARNNDVTPKPPAERSRSRFHRWLVTGYAALTLLGLALPYLSLKWNDTAVANAAVAPTVALQHARVASLLFPPDPEPLLVQERAYWNAALDALDAGARLDNFSLALKAAIQAQDRDPTNWVVALQTAKAAQYLLDESILAEGKKLSPPGHGPGSLASSPETEAIANCLRTLTSTQLRGLVTHYAAIARTWNPLESSRTQLLYPVRIDH